MKKLISSIASVALLSLCLSCSSGEEGSNGNNGSQVAENGSVYWLDDENEPYTLGGLTVYMEAYGCMTDELQKQIDDAMNIMNTLIEEEPEPPPPPPQYLGKPSGSFVAESEGSVCNYVKAEIERIKQQISDICEDKYPEQASWCTAQVIKYASGKDLGTGKSIDGMNDDTAVKEGRPLWILENSKLAITMGTMNNGKVSLALPPKIDSHFPKIDEVLSDVEVKPLGVEVLFHTDPLMLMDNSGNPIGNLRYYKKSNDTEEHSVYYWYFSENAKINGTKLYDEYKIDAKKGWNKIYVRTKLLVNQSIKSSFTTDLSEVPAGLKWLVEELAD